MPIKRVGATVVTLGALCTALAGGASAQTWTAIESTTAFRDALAEKALTSPDGSSTYFSHADGKVSGTVGGKAYSGRWTWRDGSVCYSGRVEAEPLIEACAEVAVSQTHARFSWIGWQTIEYRIGD